MVSVYHCLFFLLDDVLLVTFDFPNVQHILFFFLRNKLFYNDIFVHALSNLILFFFLSQFFFIPQSSCPVGSARFKTL